MNATYLTALAGVAGVLLGTLGTGAMQWLAERRRERARARVAAEFIRDQLRPARLTLQNAKDAKTWWPPEHAPSFSSWVKWGPDLLTDPSIRPRPFHDVVVLLDALNASAAEAYRPLDAAERQLRELKDSPGAAARGEEAKAQEAVKEARKLTTPSGEQLGQIEASIAVVASAERALPQEDRNRRARFAVVLAVSALVLGVIVAGVVAEVIHYEDTRVTASDVANSVRAVRGAAEASCSPVVNVANAYSCELTYVVPDPPGVPLTCNLASTTALLPTRASMVASAAPLLALTSRAEPPCKVEVVTDDSVDLDPRKLFVDRLLTAVVEDVTGKARGVVSRAWNAEHPQAVTGKVQTG